MARGSPHLGDLLVPTVDPEGDDAGLTVLDLLAEMKKDRDKQQPLIDEALLRERIVLGEQWQARDPLLESTVTEIYLVDGMISENLLYPLVGTFSARVDSGRVEPQASPVHATPRDVEGARGAAQVLKYENRKCNEPALIADAAFLAQCHGDVLFYPTYDESDGPHRVMQQKEDELGPVYDPVTREPIMEEAQEYGGTVEEVIAAPNYWTNIVDEYDLASYVVVSRVIDEYVAKKRVELAGFLDPSFSRAQEKTPTDIDKAGVEAFEIWCKPEARFEMGLYALVIGDYVCRAIPYPLDHGELPGAVWKIGKVRGSPRGKTHVSDACHQQRLVNKSLRDIIARQDVSADASLIGPSSLIAQMQSSGRRRLKFDGDEKKRPAWVEGADIPGGLFECYDRAIAALHRVFGQSEATSSGGDPTDTQSGEQLKTASALDAQKIKGPRTNLEFARLRVAKQKIARAIQKWDNARLVRVIGPDGQVSAEYLRGADLDGADISLEIGSGLMSSAIAGQRLAEESAQAGYLSPEKAAEQRQTGLDQTVGDVQGMQRIDAQANAAARGQPQMPLPDVNPAQAVERLGQQLGMMATKGDMNPQAAQAVIALIQAYKQAAAMSAQKSQGPGKPSQGAGQQSKQPKQSKPGVTKMRTQAAQPEGIQ